MPIYFLRHGQTDWNLRTAHCRAKTDIPLNDDRADKPGIGVWRPSCARCCKLSLAAISILPPARSAARAKPDNGTQCSIAYGISDPMPVGLRCAVCRRSTIGNVEGHATWPDVHAMGIEPRSEPGFEYHDWRPPGGEGYASMLHAERLTGLESQLTGRPVVVVAHGGISRCIIAR